MTALTIHHRTAPVGSTTLTEIVKSINKEHQDVIGMHRQALEHARRAGNLLRQAKEEVKHGEWLEWIESNLECSERTAQTYMRIADNWDELTEKCEANAQELADFGLEQALKLIAKPKPKPQPNRPLQLADEDFGAFPRPTYQASPLKNGASRIVATEDYGDEYSLTLVKPQMIEAATSDANTFLQTLRFAVRGLQSLRGMAVQFAVQDEAEISTLVEEGVSALTGIKEDTTHE